MLLLLEVVQDAGTIAHGGVGRRRGRVASEEALGCAQQQLLQTGQEVCVGVTSLQCGMAVIAYCDNFENSY